MKLSPLSWRETREHLRADRQRLQAALADQGARGGQRGAWLYLHPGFQCVLLYRLAHHFERSGRNWLGRICWHLNLLITGADINPPAHLGPGLLIMSPAGVAIMGTAGKNLTIMQCAGLGGETGRDEDIGAGPGLALLGDDVVLGPHTGVLGPVRVGHRVRLCHAVVLTQDVGDDAVVEGARPRILRLGGGA
jgi:serine O-acetyltransferase